MNDVSRRNPRPITKRYIDVHRMCLPRLERRPSPTSNRSPAASFGSVSVWLRHRSGHSAHWLSSRESRVRESMPSRSGTILQEDVNVIIEVPIGGEPMNMSWTRPPELSSIDRFRRPCVTQATTVSCRTRYRRRRSSRCAGRQHAADRAWCGYQRSTDRRARGWKTRSGGDEKIIAVPVPRVTKRYAHTAQLHGPA